MRIVFPHRDITQPRDMITIPIGNNSYTHFCGQFCLSIFRHKTKQPSNASKLPEKPVERKPEKPAERAVDSQVCSVCKIVNRVRDGTGREATRHESAVYNLSTHLMCFWFVSPSPLPKAYRARGHPSGSPAQTLQQRLFHNVAEQVAARHELLRRLRPLLQQQLWLLSDPHARSIPAQLLQPDVHQHLQTGRPPTPRRCFTRAAKSRRRQTS